jgi:DNA-binding transcriptional MerR regulator
MRSRAVPIGKIFRYTAGVQLRARSGTDKVTGFAFSTRQVLRLLREMDGADVPLRTFAEWARNGLVVPTVAWAQRRGPGAHARLYSPADVARARVVVRLRDAGLSVPRIRLALAYVERELPEMLRPGTRARLCIDRAGGGRATIDTTLGRVSVPDGQLVLPLADVVLSERTAAHFAA